MGNVTRCDGMPRHEYVAEKGWHIFQKYQAKLIAEYIQNVKTVEVMAGSGHVMDWVKKELRKLGADTSKYQGFDDGSWGYSAPGIVRKEVNDIRLKDYTYVIMAWPPYNSPAAYDVVRHMAVGSVLLYQGESFGGCCGCDKFQDYMYDHFVPTGGHLEDSLNANHKQWEYVNDNWEVWTKVSKPKKGSNRNVRDYLKN